MYILESIMFIDRFVGGYAFYYWMLTYGDRWIVQLISDANKVL